MPIYELNNRLIFPHPRLAEADGLLAIGGDLSPERLLLAYRNGIFPWYDEGLPILWHSPDPRMVLYPENLKVSRSMRPLFNQNVFQVTYDQAFKEVIAACAVQSRKDQAGTWITSEMEEAYIQLHQLGYAHSVEVWKDGQLAGGLYGVSLGSYFCGESMFAKVSNASKFGFIDLVLQLQKRQVRLIDCQVHTDHLESLGATEIPRNTFLQELSLSLKYQDVTGNWGSIFNRSQPVSPHLSRP